MSEDKNIAPRRGKLRSFALGVALGASVLAGGNYARNCYVRNYNSSESVEARRVEAELGSKAKAIYTRGVETTIDVNGENVLVKSYFSDTDWGIGDRLEFWVGGVGLSSKAGEYYVLEKVHLPFGQIAERGDGRLTDEQWNCSEERFRDYIRQVYNERQKIIDKAIAGKK